MTDVTVVRPTCEDPVRNSVKATADWPLRFSAAAVMAGCAVLHVVMAAGAGDASGVRVLLLLAMALACVPCATHVLLEPTRRSWLRAGSVSAGMLVAHPLLDLADTGHAAHAAGAPAAVVGIGMVAGPLTAMCLAGVGAVTAGRGRGRG